MLIYKDLLGSSKDELLSDSYEPKETFDGIALEADCAMIQIGGETFDTGANASAEEGGDDADDTVQKVNNIVHSFRLQDLEYISKASGEAKKKEFKKAILSYMKALAKKLEEQGKSGDELADWKKKAETFAKHLLKNYADYDVYLGENMDTDGMPILLNYREDGVTPFVTLWKHGLIEEKV